MIGHKETVISAIRKTLTAAAVVGAVLAGSAACGTAEQLSAGEKLDQAFDQLGKEKSLSFELDLDTDAASLRALEAMSESEPGEEMPDKAVELLSGAKITVTVRSKKPLAQSGEKDLVGAAVKVRGPDGDLVEYRVVGDYVYLRSDVEAVAKAVDAPMPTVDDLPPEAGALKDALQGKWVKFSTKEMREATAGAEEPGSEAAPKPSLDTATQKKLVAAIRGVLAREVDFTTSDGEDGTEHVTAEAPFRTLITKLIGEIRPLAKDLPPGAELPSDQDLKDAPDTKVSVDFTLKNGELTEVGIDLAALAENAKVKKLGLVLRIDDDAAAPTAPSGATELDLGDLMAGFLGGPEAGAGDVELSDSDLAGLDLPDDAI